MTLIPCGYRAAGVSGVGDEISLFLFGVYCFADYFIAWNRVCLYSFSFLKIDTPFLMKPFFPMKRLSPPSPMILGAALLLTSTLIGCERSVREGKRTDADNVMPDPSAVVTYTFSVPAPEDKLAPSTPLVKELAQDPNLGRLTVSNISNEQPARELDVEFVFRTVDAFFAWREQPQTSSLLDRVAALAPNRANFKPRLSVRRPALYRSVVGRVEDRDGTGGRIAKSVTCNEDCSRIEVGYKTRANEAGSSGTGRGVGDAGDIDAVTLICQPGLAGTIESCTANN